MTTYKVIAINDQEHTCSHCGKTNLKKVAWLMPYDSEGNELAAEPAPWGTTCAARAMAPRMRDYTHAEARNFVSAQLVKTMDETNRQAYELALGIEGLVLVGGRYVLPELVAYNDGVAFYHFARICELAGIDPHSDERPTDSPMIIATRARNERLPHMNGELTAEQLYPLSVAYLTRQAAAKA